MKDTRTALEYMIENKKAYDESLDIKNGLGVRAEAELAAKDEALKWIAENDPKGNGDTYWYSEQCGVRARAALAKATS